MNQCDMCGKTCPGTSNDIDEHDFDGQVGAENADDLVLDLCVGRGECGELFGQVLGERLSRAANVAEIRLEVNRRLGSPPAETAPAPVYLPLGWHLG